MASKGKTTTTTSTTSHAPTTSSTGLRPVNNSVGVDDLVMLTEVSENSLNGNLQKRYKEGLIYTSIGPVLISCNPYKQLGIYGKEYIDLYKGKHEFEIPPHIYSVADKAYRALKSEHENQCIIISGESGAGKTEASKYIMQYIASITGSSQDVERVKNQILESNPLLEAFGNAKTLRNNNSSRFGKYMEIQFNYIGDPEGGKITNYLLEKSRVVKQTTGERNFHIFYQLLSGSSPEERELYKLLPIEQYNYLNKSRAYTADGIDDVAGFKATRKAMKVVGINEDEQKQIFKLLSAIMLIGNISFNPDNSGKTPGSTAADRQLISTIAALMGVENDLLEQALISRVITTGQGARVSSYRVPQSVEQALYARDAFAKAIYSKVFDWLVRTINKSIEVKTKGKVIGVLDIYGFEIFENNSFEQFCINYVNETLQQIFIDLTLKTEQEEYVTEGIKWVPVDYVNNKACVELIEKKPFGILALLDEECLFPEGNDNSLLEKLGKHFASHSHYSKVPLTSKVSQFIINHYAGKVHYTIDGFLDKNRDTLFNDLVSLATSSSLSLLSEIFQYQPVVEELDPTTESSKAYDRLKKSGFANQQAKNAIPTDKKRPITAGFQFKTQVTALLKSLYSCNPHYIRCIKPNEVKRALDWDSDKSAQQVKYLGLFENLLVRRAGFCYRQTYAKFMRRYYMIGKKTWPKWEGGDAKRGAELLLEELAIPAGEYQFGVNKIFIRNPQPLFQMEEKRNQRMHELATMIQSTWKMFKTRRWYLQTRAAMKIQRAYRGWLLRRECVQLKNYSQNLFQGKKERNRDSLVLSSLAFIGDFLSVANDDYTKQVLAREEGPNASVRLSVSVSKINRHQKIQKRALIVTNSNILHISTHKPKKDGSWFVVKRKIAFSALEKVSLSHLCDNFFVLHVPSETDYICETNRKTVFITLLSKLYEKQQSKPLNIEFSDSIAYRTQKGNTEAKFTKVDQLPKEQLYTAKAERGNIKISVLEGQNPDSKSFVVQQ
ncbi:myosin IA heavy chain [Heterostelium album PN500]|uniref:Myosin IA heavy chain n=1 Tax=Heterostelium pallidum (strain ATCC 26659 / Pp 5 / PN500) TaxID=670386 RepID=D3BGI5_HETP5|nr:myosin IA heavy chain [Heterostelium album PN500]EFA79585.1 myosin IA heavy chain [Heterostelium album PN500]|eukprot:XP_020431706.1 myosin IA heavy chain [Heterostelium album PN500]